MTCRFDSLPEHRSEHCPECNPPGWMDQSVNENDEDTAIVEHNHAYRVHAERTPPEGWAFLSPTDIGAHYFRDGRSFCGRALPAGREVRGDVLDAGSDPEECRRCARRAHDEAETLDALDAQEASRA